MADWLLAMRVRQSANSQYANKPLRQSATHDARPNRRELVLRPEVPGEVGDDRGLLRLRHVRPPAHHLLHRRGPLLFGEALLDEHVGGVAAVAGGFGLVLSLALGELME